MLLPGTISPRTCLILTVLVALFVLGETTEDHRLDIKFGFDIRPGSNGAPSLRILQFEDPPANRRADDDSNDSDNKRPKVKASSSDSDSDEPKKSMSKEKPKSPKSSDNSDSESSDNAESGGNDKIRSTRGMKAEDFEPEGDDPKIHSKYQKHNSGDDDSDGSSRRRRSIGASNMKRAGMFAH